MGYKAIFLRLLGSFGLQGKISKVTWVFRITRQDSKGYLVFKGHKARFLRLLGFLGLQGKIFKDTCVFSINGKISKVTWVFRATRQDL